MTPVSQDGPTTTEPGARNGSAAPILSLDGVGFRYPNGYQAVGDITLEVAPGEIIAIVGPSGCGKTTLLRLLAGLREPTSGDIARKERNGDGAHRHPCAMVFQEDTVLPWMKVRENVGLHFRFQRRLGFGWKKDAELVERVDRLLAMVGLEDFAHYYPSGLSGGMKRRVAVLTAVATLPSVLLLDEPFSALDEPTRIDVHADIYRLLREFGISAILVTHDLGEAISLSDRVLLLSKAPARIVTQFEMPFGGERDIQNLRKTPEFLESYGRIWADFERQISAGKES